MKTLFILSLAIASASYAADAPKYGPQATRLSASHAYIKNNAAVDYWALSGYYVPQQNGRSCSVASVTMVVNAARSGGDLTAADSLVTQSALLKKAGINEWEKAVNDGGHGVALDLLGPYVEKSLTAYGLKDVKVKVIHADSAKSNAEILALLAKNEKSAKDFIIANFLQSEYTGDPEGKVGHIAPVAAYDAKAKKVLIMDPDREYYEPYWVSTETFFKGLGTQDGGEKKTRGIVYVSFQ